jgi:uncharacterized iron-regulated membrane protein
MTFKKAVGKIHLWLGLSSGLLVFIIAITGCIYAFQEEIQNATQSYRFVEEQNKPFLPPSRIKSIAEHVLPDKAVHAVMYQGGGHAAKAIFYSDTATYYYFVYINQYTGEVLKVKNENADFFRFIIDGHYYLWLPPDVGHPLVASATLVFFIMVISGIILWWPRNKAGRKQRFRFNWKETTRWKRKNYDLHNVMGFYICLLAMVFAVTGLVWGFQWFNKGYYALLSGGEKFIDYEEPHSKYVANYSEDMPAMDRLWVQLQKDVPVGGSMEVHAPKDSVSTIEISINPDPKTYWKTDYRFFDQYSLKEMDVKHMWGRFHNATNAQKVMRMNYDIHVGSVLGLPGKILAFCVSLIIASLPVTGFLIWWGRRNKKSLSQKKG